MSQQSNTDQNNFIKELCTYFMDFLQSNFKRARFPKRHIKLKNEKGFKVGIDGSKYESFNKLLKQSIISGFQDKNDKLKVSKGKHTIKPNKKTLDLINKSIDKITDKDLDKLKKNIIKILKENAKSFKEDSKTAHDNVSKLVVNEFLDIIINPIKTICEPLILSQSVYDIDSLYTLEIGLTEALTTNFDENISELLNDLLINQKDNISEKIDNLISIDDVKGKLQNFFDGININDLYFEVQELVNSKSNLDKQEYYFYFSEIEFQNKRFPIFYVPINIKENKGENSFVIEFEKEIFINKKAIQFAIQEFNRENNRVGRIQSISERVINTVETENVVEKLNQVHKEIADYFRLDNSIDVLNIEPQINKNIFCVLSNNSSLSVFDKSDESLINDYEEILSLLESDNPEVADMFKSIIEDFLMNEPHSIIENLEDDWDGTNVEDKLNFTSPIPLNYEQRKILKALKKEECKYVTVEGPPGTGKSHTISAIAFDYILENKSILILSDTKYALDVVEDKINDTLNKVRHTEDFQNPILRLGKMGNTYNKILSTQSMGKIRDFHRSTKTHYKKLVENIENINTHIDNEIKEDVSTIRELDNKIFQDYLTLNNKFGEDKKYFDFDEIDKAEQNSQIDLLDYIGLVKDQQSNPLYIFLIKHFDLSKESSFAKIESIFELFGNFYELYKDVNLDASIRSLRSFDKIEFDYSEKIENYLIQYRNLRGFFGYFFKGSEVEALENKMIQDLKINHDFTLGDNGQEVAGIWSITFSRLKEVIEKHKIGNLDNDILLKLINDCDQLGELCYNELQNQNFVSLIKFLKKAPNTCKKLDIDIEKSDTLFDNKINEIEEEYLEEIHDFLSARSKVSEAFNRSNQFDYSKSILEKQNLYTSQMTYKLDNKIIDFFDTFKSTAKTLSKIIKSKSKFPSNEFDKLKEAFPCIISSVRDFAEYINLKPRLFDLIIIDEASQVSIAQALPAIIRAKKVLVLGDKKQFSNVKSIQAKNNENSYYLEKINKSFKKISSDRQVIERLKLFNVKSSILDFFENISNYDTRLKKHFRGYKEHISYSSKYFYNGDIQAIRLRPPGKTLQDIVKFKIFDNLEKEETLGNSNLNEAKFIILELEKMKSEEHKGTVGVITPFTDQQKLITSLVSKHEDRDYFLEKLRLKIMTFDTCQGEERQTVFYSMVADHKVDKLFSIFPKSLDGIDLDEQANHRAQRLNVGFSRTQECMYFVMSKKPEYLNGAIGNAVRHFYKIFNTKENLPSEDELDSKSPMEKKVLQWLRETDFYKKHSNDISVQAQFPIGDYLRQLDHNYSHPAFETDFLLSAKIKDKNHNIIIEYDGFDYHFKNSEMINEFNFEDFYTEDHYERQKALEAYGYKFIRLNKFNCADDPIKFLNHCLEESVSDKKNLLSQQIIKTANMAKNKDAKYCKKCGKIKEIKDFQDSSLKSGEGNVCNKCRVPKSKFWASRSRYRRYRRY